MDTSAIFKRYVTEIGTPWLRSLTAPDAGNIIYIAEITRVEIISALARRYREGNISADRVNQAIDIFNVDLANEYEANAARKIEPCEMLL